MRPKAAQNKGKLPASFVAKYKTKLWTWYVNVEMVCATCKDVSLKGGPCPSCPSFPLANEWTVGIMAGVGAAILDYEVEAKYLKMMEQHH